MSTNLLASPMIKGLLYLFFGLVLLATRPAAAQMEQSMTAQFNAMINVTPAGVYETQAARVITGGGFVYRPRVSKLQLMTMDPPRVKASCNGIDAYTGSFSFISKEAFINFLRNIAAAAPAYAFNLALSFLCKDCDQHLARLQNLSNAVNAFNINSCKMDLGENMKQIKSITDAAAEVGQSAKDLGSHWAGLSTDWNYAKDQSNRSWQRLWDASKAGNADAKERVDKVNVNAAWDASVKSSLSQWWGGILAAADERQFYETLMSFTGSLVTLPVATLDDPATEVDRTRYLPPLIQFSDFLKGGTVTIYKCPPPVAVDDDACLIDPSPTNVLTTRQTIVLPSFRNKVRDILIGDPASARPGIVYLLNSRSSTGGVALDATQKAFVTSLPGGVYAQLREIAAFPQSALTYAEALSDWIAVEMTYQYLSEVVRNQRIAGQTSKAQYLVKQWMDDLDKVDQHVAAQRNLHTSSLAALSQTLVISSKMRESLNRATAAGIRPGQFGPQF